MPTSFSESYRAGAFLSSEATGFRSRERVIVASGQVLKAGHVIGKITKGGVTVTPGTNTGNGAMGAVTLGPRAKVGDYELTAVAAAADGGRFQVIDPDGYRLADLLVAVAYDNGHFAVTLADGSADFAVGDAFTITVAAGSGQVTEYHPANVDGSGVPYGVLFDAVDATAADQAGGAIIRDAEIDAARLTWFSGATDSQKAVALAQLASNHLIAR